jgi:hypothetical protein
MPGATETEFFERADMMDTKVGRSSKEDPADVAKTGFDAMMRGDGDIVSGWTNKVSTALASVTPAGLLAEQHRAMAEPGSGLPRSNGSGRMREVAQYSLGALLVAGLAGYGLAWALGRTGGERGSDERRLRAAGYQ